MIKLSVLPIVVILVVAVSIGIGIGEGDSDREVIPPNTAGFLSGGWHPAPECVQCHVSLLSDGALRAKLGSCRCHQEIYTTGGRIDNEKIRKNAHGIKACVDCHIGSGIATSAGEIPGDELHCLHVGVDCQACHGERESLTILENGNCDFCHSSDAHFVHGEKTGSLCVVCHGSFGIKYKTEGYQMEEGVLVEKETEERTYPTISNILKALIELIFKQGKSDEER